MKFTYGFYTVQCFLKSSFKNLRCCSFLLIGEVKFHSKVIDSCFLQFLPILSYVRLSLHLSCSKQQASEESYEELIVNFNHFIFSIGLLIENFLVYCETISFFTIFKVYFKRNASFIGGRIPGTQRKSLMECWFVPDTAFSGSS